MGKLLPSQRRWIRLLGKLEKLADEYGAVEGGKQETAFGAMHSTLAMLARIAAMHRTGPADGWMAVLTYAPQLRPPACAAAATRCGAG